MCKFVENVRRLIELEFGICVSKGHDIVVHHKELFNSPRADDAMSPSIHKVQQPRVEHVAREDDDFLRML